MRNSLDNESSGRSSFRENGNVAVAAAAEPVATPDMCIYCFDALMGHFTGSPLRSPEFQDSNCPLFVTWMKTCSRDDERLRGCIGTLEPQYIHKGLRDYALTSALKDRRFSPVSWQEVAHLRCTVSLLTNYEPAGHCLDWEIGKHGLVLEFHDSRTGGTRSATYLPEIAHQEGWDHEQCIESLARKTGFNGLITDELKSSMKVTRYQSTKCSLTYQQYEAMVSN
mmetsp:Transcript_26019/g.35930  ORF Transcript_26019/g.35930 Transcript_26019/m.35930 type:complete len:224 (+) Transcript_26019:139-810(+)|eukprot:CAMPEP_0196573512 /NCGR_PEP_ID=MMETSP1081-20130531/3406_1 /TAXON_ID=36882 /ORGANISM="Pyramimonas amylifera, Strain CCMP720" /LENGTH=223 /DNA_ID=CAMNT_0041891251 /DNA_START=65 /DNA_END=736 /DNA_ORIENTATION=+